MNLIAGQLGTVKVGRKVLVEGLTTKNQKVLISMVVVTNGIDTVLMGNDSIKVKVDGRTWDFKIDLPFIRKQQTLTIV